MIIDINKISKEILRTKEEIIETLRGLRRHLMIADKSDYLLIIFTAVEIKDIFAKISFNNQFNDFVTSR